ncbi:PH domain-containing protein [Sphingomonas swuensis]|uniref:PH domain-containing protein n=1 Tax=Sphingomonas swuensis TaxID=977800 RepID=A0ABP7SEX8_9SPHN
MTADEAPPERLHPLTLVSGLGQALRNIAGGVAAGGYFAFQGKFFVALMMLGGIAVVTLGGLLLHWLRFSYRVGSDAIRIDSGILSRNLRTIPFDRVADVSIAQGPLQRLVGVAQVTLETGASSAGKEEGVLGGIVLARAEALRDHVRARRAGAAPVAGAGEAEVEGPPLFAMDLRRVLTCGLFNFSLALFAGLFGASQTLGDVIDFDPFSRKFWRPILDQSGWGGWLLDHRFGLVVGGLTVLIVAGVVTGVIRTLLREYGFRLDRTGNGLRRRRGLLTRTDVTLPRRRIQAGLIATGPIRERFGWRAVKVLSLAGESQEGRQGGSSDHVLAALADEAEVARIGAELGWTMPGKGTDWRRVSKAHVWSFLLLMAPLFPLLLLFGPLRWFEWRNTAYAVEGERLLLRTGWWQRRTLLLPLANVQSVALAETSLSRLFGVAALVVDIAGGPAGGQRIPALPRNEASLLAKELLSRQP